MVISQVIGITGARLIGKPRIRAVEGLCFVGNKTRRGDLFIARQHKDIKQALKKGAFGILFEGDFTPIDDEIAWLQANNLERACGALGRYLVVDYALRCIALAPLALDIAQLFFPAQNAIFAKNNKTQFLEQLAQRFCLDREEDDGIFAPTISNANLHRNQGDSLPYIFAPPEFFADIDMEQNHVDPPLEPPIHLLSSSLFSMRVQYNEQIYTLPLPVLFFETLKHLLAIAQSLDIPIELSHMLAPESLQFFGFNAQGFLNEHKNTTKTLLILQKFLYFEPFMQYFEYNTPWARKLYLLSHQLGQSLKPARVFTNTKNAMTHIKQSNAHYIILCCSESETKTILSAFEQPQIQKSLFDSNL